MLETIYNHDDTDERCGLVLTDGSIVEIENIAEDKTNSYVMSPDAVLPFLKAKTIRGTWHTHPKGDPNLSGEDRKGFLAYPELEHSIIGWREDKVTVVTYKIEEGLMLVCD